MNSLSTERLYWLTPTHAPCLTDADRNRVLLDRRVICNLLGFDEDTYHAVRRLSAKWCAEPSVHCGMRRWEDDGPYDVEVVDYH